VSEIESFQSPGESCEILDRKFSAKVGQMDLELLRDSRFRIGPSDFGRILPRLGAVSKTLLYDG